jgi:hypothetical protein
MSLPGAPEKPAGVPENIQFLVMDGFAGLNTKATRPAIGDQENSWCDNFMPLGKNNLRSLYDVGPALYTATSGTTITSFYFGNIGDIPHMYVFQSDGSVVQVHTDTGFVHGNVLNAGGIIMPTGQRGVAQWGSQYAVIVAPQPGGYFLFDDQNTFQPGTLGPVVTLTDGGGGYTSQPFMSTIGGAGSGASFSAQLSSTGALARITVTNPGNGYDPDDIIAIAFTGGGSTQTARAHATLTGGSLASIVVTLSGTGYGIGGPGTVTVSLEGGGGIGATAVASGFSPTGGILSIPITASGQGYTSAPTVVITDPNNPVAQATVAAMPFGVSGTSVETYQSRVWVANGAALTQGSGVPAKNLVQFSAPNNAADFSTVDGGGQFTANDSFVRVGYHGLRQSNGFLYLVGDSSINYVAGVQTTGTPPLTTFSNQNVDPQIGTPWPDTLQVYSRALVFANSFGVFAMYGGAVQKVSTPLDNLFTSVTPTGGTNPFYSSLVPTGPSSAVAVVFGIHVYVLLLPIVDAFTGQQQNALLMWDGQKWWTASQSVNLTFINSQEINSVLTAFGTDGTSIYPLFNTPSGKIQKVVQSKLWDTPNYVMVKLNRWLSGVFSVMSTTSGILYDGIPASITVGIDTEFGNALATIDEVSAFEMQWLNSSGQTITWLNGSTPLVWLRGGFVVFGPDLVSTSGRLMGMTVTTNTPDITLVSLSMVTQQEKLNL